MLLPVLCLTLSPLSMLARLYICWRWWRRTDLPQVLAAATRLVQNKLRPGQGAACNAASAGGAASATTSHCRASSTTGSSYGAEEEETMRCVYDWLQQTCKHMTGTTSSSTTSCDVAKLPVARALPDSDVLRWTEDVPELAGFSKFLAAALGCYNDAKGHLDRLLLQCMLQLLKTLPDGQQGELCNRSQ